MARTVSATARTALYSADTEEVFVLLVEIENEAEPSQPIRVALNHEDVDSKITVGGSDLYSPAETFAGGFFQIELPEEAGENISTVRISIDNVDRSIVTAIRNTSEPPAVTMWVVIASAPDIVEAGPFNLQLESATYDASFVTGEMSFEDVTNRRWPMHSFTPYYTPGLF